jgi:hypothetical protein
MSAFPPKADVPQHRLDVRFVPKADILRCSEECRYSITSSARPRSGNGIEMPSAFAVWALITSSNFVACRRA